MILKVFRAIAACYLHGLDHEKGCFKKLVFRQSLVCSIANTGVCIVLNKPFLEKLFTYRFAETIYM